MIVERQRARLGRPRRTERVGGGLARLGVCVLVAGVAACSTAPRPRTVAFQMEAPVPVGRGAHAHHGEKSVSREHWTTSVPPATTETPQGRAETVQAAGTLFADDLGSCVKQYDPKHVGRLRTHRQYDPRLWFVGRTHSGPVVRCMNGHGWRVSGATPEPEPPQGAL